MSVHVRTLTVVIGAAVLMLPACGAGDADPDVSSPAPAWSQGAVPTPAQLASVLLIDGDLPGQWEYARRPGGIFVLCPQASAESTQAADDLDWQAGVQLDQIPDGATATSAANATAPIITVDEFLLAEDPAQVEATFTALRDGTQACYGPSTMTSTGEFDTADGLPLVSAPMTPPEVGDDRFGNVDSYPQGFPGSPHAGSPAYMHTAIIRDGPVLMMIGVGEENTSPTDPQLNQADIDAIITTAAAKLP